MSIRIKRGEVVSILGDNGSGKSTLSKIVCGILQDYDGDVLMNGENYRDIPHGTLSRFFGVAFQDFARYSLSVRENIGFGCIEEIDDGSLVGKAAEVGGLTEMVGGCLPGLTRWLARNMIRTGRNCPGVNGSGLPWRAPIWGSLNS